MCCLLPAVSLSSCGYKLSGAKSALPDGVRTIAVTPFQNLTLEPDVGVIAAEAVQREILRRKMIKLAPPDKADAVLIGVVTEVEIDPQAYDAEGFTTAYRAKLTVSAKLVRGGETIWRADKISDAEEIDVNSSIPDNDVRRRNALAAIAEDIAEKLHVAMIEGW